MRGSDRKRFLVYCLYAFGVPFLMAGTVFTIDNTNIFDARFKVGMGESNCWFKHDVDPKAELAFIYIPLALILLFNISCYSITAYKIHCVQKETSMIREANSSKHSKINNEKNRFFLYLRLFIVMGVVWVMELASWACENSLILHLLDIPNCIQGIIIFFMFVWKPKVKSLIIKR